VGTTVRIRKRQRDSGDRGELLPARDRGCVVPLPGRGRGEVAARLAVTARFPPTATGGFPRRASVFPMTKGAPGF
jgi:hypothetical protein